MAQSNPFGRHMFFLKKNYECIGYGNTEIPGCLHTWFDKTIILLHDVYFITCWFPVLLNEWDENKQNATNQGLNIARMKSDDIERIKISWHVTFYCFSRLKYIYPFLYCIF